MGLRICGWCQRHLGTFRGEGVSHGICHDCHADMLEQAAGIERLHRHRYRRHRAEIVWGFLVLVVLALVLLAP